MINYSKLEFLTSGYHIQQVGVAFVTEVVSEEK